MKDGLGDRRRTSPWASTGAPDIDAAREGERKAELGRDLARVSAEPGDWARPDVSSAEALTADLDALALQWRDLAQSALDESTAWVLYDIVDALAERDADRLAESERLARRHFARRGTRSARGRAASKRKFRAPRSQAPYATTLGQLAEHLAASLASDEAREQLTGATTAELALKVYRPPGNRNRLRDLGHEELARRATQVENDLPRTAGRARLALVRAKDTNAREVTARARVRALLRAWGFDRNEVHNALGRLMF
ncbi:MAG: hypothetical protein HYZ29_13965 [Myxococcales bacterium]|nr:hypothetical protein [Myxococcales bacterium]